MSINTLYVIAIGVGIAMVLFLAGLVIKLVIEDIRADREEARHASSRHLWPGMHHKVTAYLDRQYGKKVSDRDSLDDLTGKFQPAPTHVVGPVPAAPPAVSPPAGPTASTRVHTTEVHPVQQWAAAAWERVAATPNQVKGYWTAADRGDYSDTGWSKREGLELRIRLAEEALGGFDNIVDYATSGIQARWTEVA